MCPRLSETQKNKARTLRAQYACTDKNRFLLGTCSLHDSNELNVIHYLEDSNHSEIEQLYNHPDQIHGLEVSSITCNNK